MLVLPPELTHRQARASLGMLLDAARAEDETPVVLDAAALERFDSSVLAVLLALRRACEQKGKPLSVIGMPQQLRELAGLYGVDSLLLPADRSSSE
ncbi:MAG: STAS domain-containing protein [Ottowia sp.]|nr:STAS domain-containing protein [Ottowia sp.]